MPVDFLSDEQARAYARFDGEPTDIELARFFYLDAKDEALLSGRRGDHNRLGFALQLCSVRYLGTLLEDVRAIPDKVIGYVARQLDVADAPRVWNGTRRSKRVGTTPPRSARRADIASSATPPPSFRWRVCSIRGPGCARNAPARSSRSR